MNSYGVITFIVDLVKSLTLRVIIISAPDFKADKYCIASSKISIYMFSKYLWNFPQILGKSKKYSYFCCKLKIVIYGKEYCFFS